MAAASGRRSAEPFDRAATLELVASVRRRSSSAAGVNDDAMVGALKDIRRRVRAIKRQSAASGGAASRSSSAQGSVPVPMSPLHTNPIRFIEGEKIESDYQHMCRTGQAANEGVVQHRLSKDGLFLKVERGPRVEAGESHENESKTFRALMELPSLTQRERRLANRIPGKASDANGRSVYPWDANGGLHRKDNIAVLDGYRYVRTGPVDGCGAVWSARRELAANMGVSMDELEQIPEYAQHTERGLQISTPQVPRTNAARRNYPISARNTNFGANKSLDVEYGQQNPEDDPTAEVNPVHRRSSYWKPDAKTGGVETTICETRWGAQSVPPWN